ELYLGAITPNTWTKLQSELVPSAFPTQEHVSVICGSLIRTGLTTAEAPKLGHSPSHSVTILLNEIADLINFEQAYRQYSNY
ncbi:MAG TPA: hypothetical protein VHP34_11725, partial [Alphaproteobacteria bacterium]|nr:hypothetical protein [Alphaproteobacteria bacterium]